MKFDKEKAKKVYLEMYGNTIYEREFYSDFDEAWENLWNYADWWNAEFETYEDFCEWLSPQMSDS
jgi:hypothetical protein